MKKRLLAALLACGMLLSGCGREEAPVETTEAKQEDPLVLAYREHTYEPAAEYRYNEAGQLVRKIMPEAGREEVYEYHSNGALQRVTTLKDGKVDIVTEHDSKGNVTEETHFLINRSLHYRYENAYDDLGRLSKVTYSVNTDGEWVVVCETTYLYDDQDRILEKSEKNIYHDDPGDLQHWILRDQYTYFDNGDYEHDWYCYYYSSDPEPVPHCHKVRRYNAQGHLVSWLWDLDNMTECLDKGEYSFDEWGNPVSYISSNQYYENGGGMEITYENLYTSDNKLSQVKQYRYEYETESGVMTEEKPMALYSTTVYAYDDQGRMRREVTTFTEYDYVVEHFWEYDQWGNLIHAKYETDEEVPSEVEERSEYRPLSEVLDNPG